MVVSKTEWHKKYRELLVGEAGMTKEMAMDYLMSNKQFFDYGYSPFFYVKEEMACLSGYSVFKVCYMFGGKVVHSGNGTVSNGSE